MCPAPLANTLGRIAAEATDKRDQVEQEERAKFPELLTQRWSAMRPLAFEAAEATKTSYTVPFMMRLLNMKVFNPTRSDFINNLPKELAQMHKSDQLEVSLNTSHDYRYITFQVTMTFEKNTKEYIAKLKRTREASDTTEKKKKVKTTREESDTTEEKKKVKTEERIANFFSQ